MNSPQVPSLRTELQQQPRVIDSDIVPLLIPVEWMRYCEVCDSERIFIAKERCPSGLVGQCQQCGEVRIGVFTRTEWESYT